MKIVSIILTLFALTTLCDGLKCYQCFYYRSSMRIPDEIETNNTCLYGYTLNNQSLVDCTGQKSIFQLLSLENDKVSTRESPDGYLCGKVTISATANGHRYNGIVRGCVFQSEVQQYRNNCTIQSAKNLYSRGIESGMAKSLLDLNTTGFYVETSSHVSTCVCSDNGCNATSNLFTENIFLFMVVFLVLVTK